jgi:hypothetical protein
MENGWAGVAVAAGLLAAAGARAAEPGRAAEPAVVPPASTPILTLSSPLLRTAMGKTHMAWLYPEKAPDFRLKVERPELAAPWTAAEMETRFRGLEFRLPLEGVWVGYETPASEDDRPRATFSIQRGF